MELLGLLPSFGNLLWTIIFFIAALSIIVAVHEYGHYIIGRICGIKADVFSLGMGPKIWGRTDRHGTHWQVALLPFGGYVKFRGDEDPASATHDAAGLAQMSAESRRTTMAGAPLWARTAAVAAGPLFNFAFSILIFTGLVLFTGIATEEARIGGIKPLPTQIELQEGDLIRTIDGRPVETLGDVFDLAAEIPAASVLQYGVERQGEMRTVSGPFPLPPLAGAVQPDSAAQSAGMKAGDVILSIDGQPLSTFGQLREIVGDSDGATMQLEIWRGGETQQLTLAPRRMDLPRPEGGFETRWLIGLSGGLAFEPETRGAGLFEALWLGVKQTYFIITTSLSGLWHMVTGAISSCNLQGPLGIAETSGQAAAQGTMSFIAFVAAMSTAVGLLNLFPVPVLDGGHLVFYAFEAVTGKPPSEAALRRLMGVGLFLLLSLMVFALTNDLLCP